MGQSSRFGTDPGLPPSPYLSGTSKLGKSPVVPHAQVIKTKRTSYRSLLVSFMSFGGWWASQTPHRPHPPPSLMISPTPYLFSARTPAFSRDEAPLTGPVSAPSSSLRIGTGVGVPHSPSHVQVHAHPLKISHHPSLDLFLCQSS